MAPATLRSLSVRPNRADELVAALDHHRVDQSSSSWVIYVLGVHTDGRDLWIQVAPDERGGDDVVLHFPPEATAEDALTALGQVQFGKSEHPQIVEVLHQA